MAAQELGRAKQLLKASEVQSGTRGDGDGGCELYSRRG